MKVSNVRKKCVMPLSLPVEVTAAKPVTVETGIITKWVKITPEVATRWLEECNTNNRTIRDAYVSRLASDMASGKWVGRNGEAIRFDTNNRLVDGQHRLWACTQAGVPFESVVMWGMDPEAYKTIGIGRSKSFADFLGPVHGEKNTHQYAAAVRLVYHWSNGTLAFMQDGTKMPTIMDLEATYKIHPMLAESVTWAANKPCTRFLTPGFCVLIHYAGYCAGITGSAQDFLDRLGTGLGLTGDDPVYQLRKFLEAQRGPVMGTKRHGKLFILALAIKAWNYHKEDKKVSQLRFRVGEDFPQL